MRKFRDKMIYRAVKHMTDKECVKSLAFLYFITIAFHATKYKMLSEDEFSGMEDFDC